MVSLKRKFNQFRRTRGTEGRTRKLYLVVTIVVTIILTNTFLFSQNSFEGKSESGDIVKVVRVIDGDTIELANGQRVRYIGIDTPETGLGGDRIKECFSEEATKRNKQLVEGRDVKLVKDVGEIDKYGRILRYVYIEDTFVNEVLVREGYAHAFNVYPDEKFKDLFKEAENDAKINKKGLWGDGVCE